MAYGTKFMAAGGKLFFLRICRLAYAAAVGGRHAVVLRIGLQDCHSTDGAGSESMPVDRSMDGDRDAVCIQVHGAVFTRCAYYRTGWNQFLYVQVAQLYH